VLGLTIAALVLVRRRWPVAVLVASAATLQLYYLLDYAGIRPAVPLSVALATASAAGHPRWSLAVAAWFAGAPLLFRTLVDPEPLRRVLDDTVPDVVLLAAVLVLGEAVRNRRALDLEREKSERLLLNVLPASIATRLKQTEGVIADGFPDVTVLFADIVDFTSRSERIAPEQVVEVLNDLFSAFDRLCRDRRLEKIKTIGDAYVVVGGLPEPRPDHAEAVAEMALAIQEEVAARSDPSGQPLQVRIGIDTGPVAMVGCGLRTRRAVHRPARTRARTARRALPAMRPAGLGLVLQLLQGGHGSGMGGLSSLRCLLGGPDPVGHLGRVAVGTLGRLAGLLGGGGGRSGLFGEVLGDRGQLVGTLLGRLGNLLAAGGQPLGLLQDDLGLLGSPAGLLQRSPGCRPGLLTPRSRPLDRRHRRFRDHVGGGGRLR
jgi:class 3 adenylate cyclase